MKRFRALLVLLTFLTGASLGLLAYAETPDLAGRMTTTAAPPQETKYAVQETGMADEAIHEEETTASVAQTSVELSIDDGSFEAGIGLNQPGTIHIINRLQPPSYPATLAQLRIFFRTNDNLTPGSAITLLVGSNPDGNENIDGTSFQQVGASIQVLGQFNTYSVPNITINSGDFVVGFRMPVSPNVFPGALDTNSPSHRRSYVSTDGFNFDLTEERNDVPDGNFGIRAGVNLQPPILSVTPSSLTFNTVVGQTTPPGQTFTVSNVGSGILNYDISISDTSLVSISPSSGTLSAGQSNVISVFVTPPTQPGTRTAFLSVNAPGAQNSPQTVTVTVNTTSPPAILSVTPTSLTFNAVVGQGNPPPQAITVQNSGDSFLNFTISSNSGFVTASPTSGSLSGGQATTIQVSAFNPNSAGTINAQLTVSAPGAQNSPQFVNVTINTQPGVQDEGEPNNSPQSATFLPTPSPGQSLTVTGNARPNDSGTTVNQLNSECDHNGLVQDWFRWTVNQRAAFQVTLNFQGSDVNFDLWLFIQTNDFTNFPEGVQLMAFSAQGPGQQETIGSQVLEPGTYFIGVSRVRRNIFDNTLANYTLRLTSGVSPELHAVEDAACAGFILNNPGTNGFFVVNRVRPTRHPARLEAIIVLLARSPGQPSPNGRPLRIIAFTDPSGSGAPPFNPGLVVNQTIIANASDDPSEGRFNQLNLGTSGPVIFQGDFYVGYVIDTFNGIFPNLGRVLYPTIRSFVSMNNGQTYQPFNIQDMSGRIFNVAARAVVNAMPFGKMSAEDAGDRPGHEKMEMIRPRMIPIDEP